MTLLPSQPRHILYPQYWHPELRFLLVQLTKVRQTEFPFVWWLIWPSGFGTVGTGRHVFFHLLHVATLLNGLDAHLHLLSTVALLGFCIRHDLLSPFFLGLTDPPGPFFFFLPFSSFYFPADSATSLSKHTFFFYLGALLAPLSKIAGVLGRGNSSLALFLVRAPAT